MLPTINYHVEKAGSYIQTAADTVGAIVATGAITLPWWHDKLHMASSVATDIAPIAGVLWLVVQIVHRLLHWTAKAADGGDD